MIKAIFALLFLSLALPAKADPAALARTIGADVLFLRHALAPGTGDPAGFRLEDCSTQRNLSDEGREQARALGNAIRASNLPVAQVLTSQWCRARDTATLLNLGDPVDEPGLNSFFGNSDARAPTLDTLTKTLATLPDGITVMVTHQVVITAITGQTVPSGGAVLYDVDTGRAEPIPLP
jgi:broad specificity phosphatase PhoE